MRKNVRNDKVVKAITIGLAAMLAVTSTPVTAWAEEPVSAPTGQPETPSEAPASSEAPAEAAAPAQSNPEPAAGQSNPEPAAEQSNPQPSAEQSAPQQSEAPAVSVEVNTPIEGNGPVEAAPAANEVSFAAPMAMLASAPAPAAPAPAENTADPIDQAAAAISPALEEVVAHQEQTNGGSNTDTLIKNELTAGQELLQNSSEAVKNFDVAAADVNADTADQAIGTLDNTLNGLYLENANKDDKNKDRAKYIVERDENGDLKLDDKDSPVFGKTVDGKDYTTPNQLSGQYDTDKDKYKDRSVQGLYQDGVNLVKDSIDLADKDNNKDAAQKKIDEAVKKLDAAIVRFDNSTSDLKKAREEYEAAKAASEASDQELRDGKVFDVVEAVDNINKAKENADRLAKAREQYYALLVHYYTSSGKAEFNEDGTLNIEKSANNTKNGATNVGTNGYMLGKELLKQLVINNLVNEGVDPETIQFGIKEENLTEQAAAKGIISTVDGNDSVSVEETDKQYWENTLGNDGRNKHVKVTYVKDGHTETKYFNYIIKKSGNNYEGSNLHMENGPIYVSEVKQDENGVWAYTHYDADNNAYLDNYNLLAAAAEAQEAERKAVDSAADKVNKLTKELYTLGTKVATNSAKLEELRLKLNAAELAYKESKESLEDLNDLIYAMNKKLGNEEYEKREIKGLDYEYHPAASEVEEEGSVTEDVIPGDDITVDDAGDNTSVNPSPAGGTGSDAAPAVYTEPATLADGGVTIPGITPSFDFGAGTGAGAGTGTADTGSYSVPGISTIGTTVASALSTGTTIDLGSATVTLPSFDGTGVAGTRGRGVAGVRAEDVEGNDEKGKDTKEVKEDKKEVKDNVKKENKVNKTNKKIVKKIDENKTPLAAKKDENSFNPLWLILLALAAAAKKMYDKYQESREEAKVEVNESDK